jgi:preprotein translocase subunit Sec63
VQTRARRWAAGAVVAAFVAVAVGHEAHSWEPNYFEVFNIPRTASSKEVRAVWKEMSKVTHPDVNPSPDAEEEFVKLTRAKDTLTGVSSRKVYVDALRPIARLCLQSTCPSHRLTPRPTRRAARALYVANRPPQL